MFKKSAHFTSAIILLLTLTGGTAFADSTTPTPNLNATTAPSNAINYKRIIVTGNCPFGVLMINNDAYKNVVGAGPWTFLNANMDLLRDMKPDIDRITTQYINTDYKVNIESLLNLKPDVIFFQGKRQNDHLERTGAKLVDLSVDGPANYDPELMQVAWEQEYAKTLGFPYENRFQTAWDTEKAKIAPLVQQIQNRHATALFLHTSNDKEIRVSGDKTYGDSYLKNAGFKNVASDIQMAGDSGRFIGVSMEQIMKWNPDVIFVTYGSAQKILNNQLAGQDWKNLKAVKTGKVFSLPLGMHSWGGISAEAPLTSLYMVNHYDNQLLSDQEFRQIAKTYYKKMFDYTISDKLLDEVLSQR